MTQKGMVSYLVLIIAIVGLILGVYFIDQRTGFLSRAWDSNPGVPRSNTIKIATGSGKPAKIATESAKPATASAKPSTIATSSASPSASASAKPAK